LKVHHCNHQNPLKSYKFRPGVLGEVGRGGEEEGGIMKMSRMRRGRKMRRWRR